MSLYIHVSKLPPAHSTGGAGGGQLTPDDALDLVEELLPAKIRSRELGLALKLPPTVISEIHDSFSDPRLRLFHILLEFTSQSQPRPTWRLLIDALRSSEVRLPALAHRLEEIYIPTSVPSTTAGEKSWLFVCEWIWVLF